MHAAPSIFTRRCFCTVILKSSGVSEKGLGFRGFPLKIFPHILSSALDLGTLKKCILFLEAPQYGSIHKQANPNMDSQQLLALL